jgi:hypothetical protein
MLYERRLGHSVEQIAVGAVVAAEGKAVLCRHQVVNRSAVPDA